ncbi:EFR1 family ferrodoxin [Cellulosilyticum ruminicola]|uniref:EFR1 family ferrodoxin n=1 Tax=Cellulosilyticum ruminicola TaxID=425254 RepID=UPI0006D1E128|nr:EFR1 family ferrodoxin [Cellulosilyticum ruminicola]
MKGIIYYFSGTGNNYMTAKKLSSLLPNTTFKEITTLLYDKVSINNYDLIGFCFPSYYSHIPSVITQCFQDIYLKPSQKIFTIIGCGGNRGHATEDIRKLINDANGTVSYEYMLIYPGSYIISYDAPPKLYQKLVLALSNRKIKKISNDLLMNHPPIILSKGLFYKADDEPRLQKAIQNFGPQARTYTVSEDCKGCGICQSVCPMHNVSLIDGKPTFGTSCEKCMACIQWCPQHAIDWQGLAQKRTRYHHPEVTCKELTKHP